MTAQRYCVHLSYTADAAPWAVSIFPANTEPTLSDTLPTVLVSSPMTCDAAEHLVRQFYDQAVEGLRPCDYASGRA